MSKNLAQDASYGAWAAVEAAIPSADHSALQNDVSESGTTLLEEACMNGRIEVIRALLRKKVNPNGLRDGFLTNEETKSKATPLLLALNAYLLSDRNTAAASKLEIAKELLDAGADPNLDFRRTQRSLLSRVRINKAQSLQILEALLKAGADPMAKDKEHGLPISALAKRMTSSSDPTQSMYYIHGFALIIESVENPLEMSQSFYEEALRPDYFLAMAPALLYAINIGFHYPSELQLFDGYRSGSMTARLPHSALEISETSRFPCLAPIKEALHEGIISSKELERFFIDDKQIGTPTRELMKKTLDKVLARLRGISDFVENDSFYMNLFVQKGALEHILALANNEGVDLSYYLTTPNPNTGATVIDSILRNKMTDTLLHFPYWERFPQGFEYIKYSATEIIRDMTASGYSRADHRKVLEFHTRLNGAINWDFPHEELELEQAQGVSSPARTKGNQWDR